MENVISRNLCYVSHLQERGISQHICHGSKLSISLYIVCYISLKIIATDFCRDGRMELYWVSMNKRPSVSFMALTKKYYIHDFL